MHNRQAGMSIVELMISLLLGVFVIGGVLTVYLAISRSSADTIAQSRLNAEMSALMNIMANDVRRAGYWEIDTDNDGAYSQAELDVYLPQNNPFNQATTMLNIIDVASNASQLPQGATSDCILYTYDADRDGQVDDGTMDHDGDGTDEAADGFGFRLNGTGIDMRLTGSTSNSCTTGGEWQGIVDTSLIEVTNLNFDMSSSKCANASEPDGVDNDADTVVDNEEDCYSVNPSSGDSTTQIREVTITLQARLLQDTLVQGTLVQTVRVRNDLIQVTP